MGAGINAEIADEKKLREDLPLSRLRHQEADLLSEAAITVLMHSESGANVSIVYDG
jgi:hypothetical protein